MISLNSLSAFTPEVTRGGVDTTPVRATSPVAGQAAGAMDGVQRKLEAVPAQPASPLPRGSLLDLRV